MKKILIKLKENTSNKTRVTLAFGLKLKNAFKGIEEIIHDSGYHLLIDSPILYNADRLVTGSKIDTYFELLPEASINSSKTSAKTILAKENKTLLDEAIFYLRAIAYLCNNQDQVSLQKKNYKPLKLFPEKL